MDQIDYGITKIPTCILEEIQSKCISLLSSLCYIGCCDASRPGLLLLLQQTLLTSCKCFPRQTSNGCPRSKRFEMSTPPTSTYSPTWFYNHMAHFASTSVQSEYKLPINDDASTYPCAHCQIKEVLQTFTRTIGIFTQGRKTCIIGEKDRHSHPLTKHVCKRHISPSW